jgi:peptide deformylase
MDKMSELFTYSTAETVKQTAPTATKQLPKVFDLVDENSKILRLKLKEFDFQNPPVNANEFASTLVETCKENKGLGLSANQCGFPHRVFVMGAEDEYVAFFNPKVISSEGEAHMIEGCLSFPLLGLRITRPQEIVVEYQDFLGVKHTTRLNGISARIFLHELDHMDGIVYTERAKPLALKSGQEKRQKTIREISKSQAEYMNMMEKIEKQNNGKTAN